MERNHSLQLQFALCFSHFNHCSARVKSLHTSQHLPCKPSQQPAKAITRRFSVQHCVPFGAQFHIATARNHLATNQGLNHSSLATRSYQKAANRFLGMCDYCLTSSVCFFFILPFLLLLYASVFYSVKIIKYSYPPACSQSYWVKMILPKFRDVAMIILWISVYQWWYKVNTCSNIWKFLLSNE